MKFLSAGLTALDLLVTMVIVAILIAASVPGFQAYLLENRLRAATAAMQSHLLYARSEAIHGRVSTIICPGNRDSGCMIGRDWHQGWIVFSDANGDRDYQAEETLLRVGHPTEAVQISSSAARRRLRFLRNGTAPGSNTTIRLCTPADPSRGRRVRLSNSGRVVSDKIGEGDITGC